MKLAANLPSSSSPSRPISVVALGAFGGRFDQEISSIHGLHKWKDTFDRIVLLDKENAAFLLHGVEILHDSDPEKSDAFVHTHRVQCVEGIEGPTCGLLPLAGPAEQVWTRGLHWNLHGNRLKMGELVSSSNYVERRTDSAPAPASELMIASASASGSAVACIEPEEPVSKHARVAETLTTKEFSPGSSKRFPLSDVLVTTTNDLIWVWNIQWPPIGTK